MNQRYSMLQKKLQEVETQLNKVRLLPPQTPHHETYAQDIKQRLEFLNTLLSAEQVSNPQNPHHLHHIRKSITSLESVFREWNEFRTTPDHNPLDTVSACSCSESCLNDDGDDDVEIESCVVDGKKEEEEEEVRVSGGGGGGGRRVGTALAMGGGVLIGMGLSIVSFVALSLSYSSSPNAMGLIPT